ncbi:uncharacterized protein TrAtP1_009545 [Trichoderma atroviride]|uniref:uncharacterized protein n=1 Tax=Hypocrea atroviridis TaxID=63577 RepID=UPI003326ADB4|nr:hypothetical protein TrAtP1_009545 [Trichoderma atroviride]
MYIAPYTPILSVRKWLYGQPKVPTSDFSANSTNTKKPPDIKTQLHPHANASQNSVAAYRHFISLSPLISPREIVYSNTARFVRLAATSSTTGKVVPWVQVTW